MSMHISRRVTSRHRRQLSRQVNRRLSRLIAVGLVTVVAVAMAPASSAAADPPTFTGQGLTSTSRQTAPKAATSRLAQSDPAVLQATGTAKVPVLVKLDYDSVATYSGGLQNLQPTSPRPPTANCDENTDAVRQYDTYVAGVEDTFTAQLSSAIPEATVGTRLRTVFGGIALSLPADRAKDLLNLPGVVAVQADTLNQPLTDSSPEFIGAPTLYDALGSDTTAGKGAIVGVLDTGSLAGASLVRRPRHRRPAAESGRHRRTCDFGDNPLTPAADFPVQQQADQRASRSWTPITGQRSRRPTGQRAGQRRPWHPHRLDQRRAGGRQRHRLRRRSRRNSWHRAGRPCRGVQDLRRAGLL